MEDKNENNKALHKEEATLKEENQSVRLPESRQEKSTCKISFFISI